MARVATIPSSILTATTVRLRTQLGLSAEDCFVADPTNEYQGPPAETWITVWLGDGVFDQEAVAGGTALAVTTVQVTAWTTVHALDQAGKDFQLASHAARGLLPLAKLVVAELMLHDLVSAGNEILAQPLRPVGWTQMQKKVGANALASAITVDFEAKFLWG